MRTAAATGILAACFFMMTACVSQTYSLPEPPPPYVQSAGDGSSAAVPARGSLWSDASAGLFEDRKARRVNDLLTVIVMERVSGSKKAETSASRDSEFKAGITDFFGAPLNLNTRNFYGRGNTFSPTLGADGKTSFKGSGETTREGNLIGTITAKVVEVQPNGNLVIESRKEITLNKEKQIFILRGIVRPDDIRPDNTIQSTRVADARLYYVGDGVVSEKQAPGWFGRLMDYVWPF